VSIVNASPTSLTDRQIPAMQNHGSPVFVNSHLSLRLFFFVGGVRELVKAVGGDEAGRVTRMGGGDKPMRAIGGQTILDCVISRLGPQCDDLLLNANGDPRRFAAFGLPIVADKVSGHPGPLAGVLAALDWVAAQRPGTRWVVSVPGDCPFLPHDLAARLHRDLDEAPPLRPWLFRMFITARSTCCAAERSA
jgi:hypothetical protein